MTDWTAARHAATAMAAAWHDAPGGCIVLFDGDGPRAAIADGLASLEHRIPFTADTPTRYASISKHVLAACLLQQGVDLARPLAATLPTLPDAIGAVPLIRALDMTGGLPDLMELLWQRGTRFTATLSRTDLEATLQTIGATSTPPGQEMAYSNTGWRLGQSVLEAHAGQDYATILRRIAGPGIHVPGDETDPIPGLATGYWRDAAMWRRGRYGLNFSASGALAGSANTLAAWAAALLRDSARLGALSTPRAFTDGAPSAYRLGLVATSLGGTPILAHGGSLPGYRNHLVLAPGQGVGLALLMNRDDDALTPALQIMAALLGEPAPTPATGLPPGLYAAPEGPAWAELHGDAIEFMGARETLYPGATNLRSVPGSLELDITATTETITGRIGGTPRTLTRVPPGTQLHPALPGTWREHPNAPALVIRLDATACLHGIDTSLTPLPGPRALASLPHLMWRHRPCLSLHPDGTLHIASHRARVLRLTREA